MCALLHRIQRIYGDKILRLRVLIAALALAGHSVSVLGIANLSNPKGWWHSSAVWFALAVIGHDLVLFPLYALAERLLPPHSLPPPDTCRRVAHTIPRRVALTNYIRMPTLATGLMFALFYPGIIRQGTLTHTAATG